MCLSTKYNIEVSKGHQRELALWSGLLWAPLALSHSVIDSDVKGDTDQSVLSLLVFCFFVFSMVRFQLSRQGEYGTMESSVRSHPILCPASSVNSSCIQGKTMNTRCLFVDLRCLPLFQYCFAVSSAHVFASVVEYTPKYFIILDDIGQKSILLVFLSVCSLLLHYFVLWFSVLIFYTASLLNSCICSDSNFYDILLYNIMFSGNRENFISCFIIFVCFIYLVFG